VNKQNWTQNSDPGRTSYRPCCLCHIVFYKL